MRGSVSNMMDSRSGFILVQYLIASLQCFHMLSPRVEVVNLSECSKVSEGHAPLATKVPTNWGQDLLSPAASFDALISVYSECTPHTPRTRRDTHAHTHSHILVHACTPTPTPHTRTQAPSHHTHTQTPHHTHTHTTPSHTRTHTTPSIGR